MYKVAVKIDGIERRKKTTGILHVLAGLFLLINAGTYFKQLQYENFLLVLPVFLVAVISVVYGLIRKRIDARAHYNHWIRILEFMSFTGLGIAMYNYVSVWSVAGLFLWAIVIMLLMFTERKVFHDTDLIFSEQGIHVPGYFSNHILPWNLIENIVLREDYLSIFRTNQKFVQLELLQSLSEEERKNINAFCKSRIKEGIIIETEKHN